MKTILVATDYSVPANNALEYAAQLAQKTNARLILLNVYKLNIHSSNSLASASDIDHLVKRSETKLIELALETEGRFKIKVDYELGKDDTVESLSKYIKTHAVNLVVMGIESNLVEYKWFGNTTTAAIQLMQFPLLVVPNDITFQGIQRIMYACESSYLREDCGLGVLKEFVSAFNAELQLLHVLTNEREKESKEKLELLMEKILKNVEHSYQYVSSPRVDDGIIQGLKRFPADLLVMVSHKAGFFEALFKGSQTTQMTVRTRIPLLVIPEDKVC
ncbi:MAG: hypothetical protein GC178_16270 [Flavobacteriales bacterium]|nr:hypothetical protein [Flavobacteriales bacterium]